MSGPTLKRVEGSDFQDAPPWFRKFLDLLNPFLGDTTMALSGNLTAANMRRQVEVLRVDTLAFLPDTFANNKFQLKNKLGVKPVEIRIGQVYCRTSGDSITVGTGVQWDILSNGLLVIKYIAGLNASKSYDVTLVIE